MVMGNVVTFPAHRAAAASSNGSPNRRATEREMVTAAMKSWMDGDPLTAREQRIVDTVLDTNYFGQLGRLAMGA